MPLFFQGFVWQLNQTPQQGRQDIPRSYIVVSAIGNVYITHYSSLYNAMYIVVNCETPNIPCPRIPCH